MRVSKRRKHSFQPCASVICQPLDVWKLISSVKHYVGNEQERRRMQESSNIDDRTMREIYSHPFLRGVAADAVAVMASYNLVNGSWAAQNAKTLNGILKTDFGFEGYVMSDWQGEYFLLPGSLPLRSDVIAIVILGSDLADRQAPTLES